MTSLKEGVYFKNSFVLKVFFVGHIHMSYFEANGTSVLDFWWCLLWVSKQEWVLPYSHFGDPQDPPLVLHMLHMYLNS